MREKIIKMTEKKGLRLLDKEKLAEEKKKTWNAVKSIEIHRILLLV